MGITFSHLGLVVSDMGRSLEFYRDVLGLTVRENYPDTGRGLEIAFVGNEASTLELLCYADPAKREREGKGRLDHFAWYVSDIAATMDELKKNGATFRPGDPVVVLDGRKIAYTSGPDGERIELVQKARIGTPGGESV